MNLNIGPSPLPRAGSCRMPPYQAESAASPIELAKVHVMTPQQWWFRDGDQVFGPVDTSDLRELKQLGRIVPSTLVSADEMHWVAASRLKGLFPGETGCIEPTQGAMHPPPTARERSTDGAIDVRDGLPWPIIRVEKPRFGERRIVRIVQLRPEGISLLATRSSVTDQLLTSSDQGDRPESPWTFIPAGSIRAVRNRRVGFLTSYSWWNRFTITNVGGSRHEFRVPDRDVPHVAEALRQIAGDRFVERPTRTLAVGEVAVLLAALTSIALLALGWANQTIELWVGGIFLLVFGAISVPAMNSSKRNSDLRTEGPRRVRRGRLRWWRRPFRSRTLGWSLKTVGICYLIIAIAYFDKYVGTFFVAGSPEGLPLAWIIYIPGICALILGSRLCLRTFDPRRHPDPRPPILYLRAFDDDGKRSFQPSGTLARLHGIFRYADVFKTTFVFIVHPTKLLKMFLNADTYSSEELFARVFRPCGPLVAVGRPGELLATSGADRMYVADDEWKQVVLEYLAKSQAVILQPASGEGVRWEVEHVLSLVPRHKVLLSMLNYKDRPNLYEGFRSWMQREHGVALPLDLPFQDTPACVYFEKDGTVRVQPICYRSPLLWSFIGNAVHARMTFDPFISGLQGGPRELPQHPRKARLQAAFSIPLAITFVFAFGALLGWVRLVAEPHARIATDIAGDRLKRVAPVIGGEPAKPVTYRGRAIPYEFRLDSEWKMAAIPASATTTDYFFDYRGGLGKLEIVCGKGSQLTDLFDDSLPSSLRKNVEARVRQEIPNATVELEGTRWLAINGVQWREVSLVQHYGISLSETKHILFYSGPSGWIVLNIILPNHDHYAAIRDRVLGSIRAPEAELDRVLRAANSGNATTVRGDGAPFQLTLSAAWEAKDVEDSLAGMGEAGQRLQGLIGGTTDHLFILGNDPSFASLEVWTDSGEVDVREFDEAACGEVLQSRRATLELAFPEARFEYDFVRYAPVTIAGQEWIEILAHQRMTKGAFSRKTSQITRMTSRRGRLFAVTVEINQAHPEVRRIAIEAMDSVRLED